MKKKVTTNHINNNNNNNNNNIIIISNNNNNKNNNNSINKNIKITVNNKARSNSQCSSSFKQSSFMKNLSTCFKMLYTETFTYSTVRSANINNKPVAIMYRIMQFSILAYIIGYLYIVIFFITSSYCFSYK